MANGRIKLSGMTRRAFCICLLKLSVSRAVERFQRPGTKRKKYRETGAPASEASKKLEIGVSGNSLQCWSSFVRLYILKHLML